MQAMRDDDSGKKGFLMARADRTVFKISVNAEFSCDSFSGSPKSFRLNIGRLSAVVLRDTRREVSVAKIENWASPNLARLMMMLKFPI